MKKIYTNYFRILNIKKEGKTIMRTKNKTIKILLAVAFMFTAFLMMENTVRAKTKRSTYRTINGIYNSDGTIDTVETRLTATVGKFARDHMPIQGLPL